MISLLDIRLPQRNIINIGHTGFIIFAWLVDLMW